MVMVTITLIFFLKIFDFILDNMDIIGKYKIMVIFFLNK